MPPDTIDERAERFTEQHCRLHEAAANAEQNLSQNITQLSDAIGSAVATRQENFLQSLERFEGCLKAIVLHERGFASELVRYRIDVGPRTHYLAGSQGQAAAHGGAPCAHD